MSKYVNRDLFRRRLVEMMADSNDTTYRLAETIGLSPATISRYTTGGIDEPKLPTIQAIAERYGVNPLWLMGQKGQGKYTDPTEQPKRIPIVGTIACGKPIIAEQHIEGYEYVSEGAKIDFCLRAKGDSMVGARIFDGDLVYIRQQPEVENGEIAAVMVNSNDATLKRVHKYRGMIVLRPENPTCSEQVLKGPECRNVRIIGKAMFFKSEVI